MKEQKKEKKVKKIKLLHELFPEFTSDAHLELLDKWDNAKDKNGVKKKKSAIILPDEQESEILLPDDFDIKALMAQAEDPITGTMRNLRVDDRDLPHAKNYYDFAYRIIGRDANPPWARQMWTGLMLFGEICTACTKKKYLDVHNIPKDMDSEFITDVVTLLEYGVCPKCGRNKYDLIKNHGMNLYQQLVNVLGQRSGKSSSAAGGYATYITHKYLKFPDLGSLARSEMQASTELTGTFVSLNFAKAVGVMWTPYKKAIEASSWFKEYFRILDAAKERYGTEFYRASTLYLKFYHKNMHFYPTGPRASTLRGDTRLMAMLDELGLFPLPSGDEEEDSESERANADEAHKSLMRSLTTVQSICWRLMKEGTCSVPPCVLMSVSSPYSLRDKVMRLLKQSRTEEGRKFILGINLATWDVNPSMERDTPVIAAAYAENYEKAERDYGANPPAVHSRFVPKTAYESGVFVNGQNSHIFKYEYDQPGQIYGRIERVRTFRWPSILAIDAGVTNNSFIITGMHYDFDAAKTVISTILECLPHEDRRVNFNMLYQHVILPLARDLNAVAMLADQWQSIDLLNRLQDDMGNNPLGKPRCKTKQYSPRRKDFDSVISMMRSGNLLLPTVNEVDMKYILDGNVEDFRTEMLHKPVQHLLLQLSTVKDLGPSRCPGKGDGYTDDIFRAVVLGASKIHHEAIMDRLKEARGFNYGDGPGSNRMPMPVFVGRSGGMRFPGLR